MTSTVQVTGYVDGSVQINCAYGDGYEEYLKYFCKGACDSTLVKTVEGQTKAINDRFSLNDDITNKVFAVDMTRLTEKDSGQYWCGIERNAWDIYTEVKIRVVKGKQEVC